MKHIWTKIYGPPWDYSKQKIREMEHWSNVINGTAVDPGYDYVMQVETPEYVLKSETIEYPPGHPVHTFMEAKGKELADSMDEKIYSMFKLTPYQNAEARVIALVGPYAKPAQLKTACAPLSAGNTVVVIKDKNTIGGRTVYEIPKSQLPNVGEWFEKLPKK